MPKKLKSIKKQEHLQLLEESEALLKVVYWFFAYPTKEVSLNDLSESVGISKTNANKIVTRLVDEDFLKKETIGKLWRISCNLQHFYNVSGKIPFNLSIVYQSGILEKILKDYPGAKSVILFGSYRKGDDTEESDLDVAVEVVDDGEPEIIRYGTIDKLGYRNKVAVNLHVFSRNKVDLNLFANIANGIILYGFLEVRP